MEFVNLNPTFIFINTMKVSIDRFEGEYAICEKEDGSTYDLAKDALPKGAKPGDVLDIDGDQITIDAGETEKRKKETAELVDDLFD